MKTTLSSLLFPGLLLIGATQAEASVYRGLAAAGDYRPMLRLSQGPEGAAELKVGDASWRRTAAATTWRLRYDAASGRLEASQGDPGAMPLGDAAFGLRLSRSALRPNVLRLGYLADLETAPPRVVLTTARGRRRLDTSTLAHDGGLSLVDPTLAEGFELELAAPSGVSLDALWELDLGDAAVVHLQRVGAKGEVVRTDDALLCASEGCDRQAAFLSPGGAVGLRAQVPDEDAIRFESWGNECRGNAPYTALLAPADRREFHCVATFSDAPMRAAAKGNAAMTFSNTTPITIPDSGASTPNPSTISVDSIGGLISDVNVKLDDLTHAWPDDLDVLVVPAASDDAGVVLMSDACGSTAIADFQYTFDDEAATSMNDDTICTSFFYQPSNFGAGDTWVTPAPEGPYSSALGSLDGSNPIGTWRLFVTDDGAGQSGAVESGWSVTLSTGPYAFLIPGAGTTGVAGEYPSTRNYAGAVSEIGDVNLVISGVVHSFPDDLDLLLVSPQGTAVIVMSDACGGEDITNYVWRFDDEAFASMSDSTQNGCNPITVRPTNYGTGDSWPAPAPSGPYATTMAAFYGEDPSGAWRLYAFDDASGDGGFLLSGWSLEISGPRIFAGGFESP
jgi:subtilisin-like proprotein convertase family protein